MGPDKRAVFYDRCPVGMEIQDTPDATIATWLTTFHVWRRFGKWPAGRDDPQLLEVFVTIQNERDAIERERIPTGATR